MEECLPNRRIQKEHPGFGGRFHSLGVSHSCSCSLSSYQASSNDQPYVRHYQWIEFRRSPAQRIRRAQSKSTRRTARHQPGT
ncbi:hypothetical protein M8J75_003145 [Diaphorina citri]|nr:hypothetical protein M8J75_003145 [Diaphorina citri]